jgi:SAM-dependent methyltransferase
MTAAGGEPKRVVRNGYDAVAESYLADRPRDAGDLPALEEITALVPAGGRVLDLGCGAGVPVTEHLLELGYTAAGLDLSMTQLLLARESLAGSWTQGDMTALPFGAGSFDGVVAYYSIIHVPREEHPAIVREIRRVLVPDGRALLVLGARDLPADHDEDSWFGVPMFWSHTTPGRTSSCLRRRASPSSGTTSSPTPWVTASTSSCSSGQSEAPVVARFWPNRLTRRAIRVTRKI